MGIEIIDNKVDSVKSVEKYVLVMNVPIILWELMKYLQCIKQENLE